MLEAECEHPIVLPSEQSGSAAIWSLESVKSDNAVHSAGLYSQNMLGAGYIATTHTLTCDKLDLFLLSSAAYN